ncbi:MAG TPA: hypothetical protein P5307_28165, partial [Pirellulaceae bacterium]|nr:hypothetical protein [Pirellulaceae bacterium]
SNKRRMTDRVPEEPACNELAISVPFLVREFALHEQVTTDGGDGVNHRHHEPSLRIRWDTAERIDRMLCQVFARGGTILSRLSVPGNWSRCSTES